MSNRILSLLAVLGLMGTVAWASETSPILGSSSNGTGSTFAVRDVAGALSATSFIVTGGAGTSTFFDLSVTHDLSVGHNSSLNTLSTSGAATLNSLGVTVNATVGGTLGVTGLTTATGGLTSPANIVTTGAGSISSNTSVSALSTITAGTGLTVTSGGASITGGINANSGNITNVGTSVTAAAGLTIATTGTNDLSLNAGANAVQVNSTLNSNGDTVLGSTTANTIAFKGKASTALDMANFAISHIGNAGTSFTPVTGALTLANSLTVSAGGADITGGLTQKSGAVSLNSDGAVTANTVNISTGGTTGAVTIGNQTSSVAVNAPTTVTSNTANRPLTTISAQGATLVPGSDTFGIDNTNSGTNAGASATTSTLRGMYNNASTADSHVRISALLSEGSSNGTGLGAGGNPQVTALVGLADFTGGTAPTTDFLVGVRGATFTSAGAKTNGLNIVGQNFGGTYFRSVGGYFAPDSGTDANLGSVSQVGSGAGWADAALTGKNIAVVGINYNVAGPNNLAGYFGGDVKVTGALSVGSGGSPVNSISTTPGVIVTVPVGVQALFTTDVATAVPAAAGDTVIATPTSPVAGYTWNAFVDAGVVNIRYTNSSGESPSLSHPITFTITVIH